MFACQWLATWYITGHTVLRPWPRPEWPFQNVSRLFITVSDLFSKGSNISVSLIVNWLWTHHLLSDHLWQLNANLRLRPFQSRRLIRMTDRRHCWHPTSTGKTADSIFRMWFKRWHWICCTFLHTAAVGSQNGHMWYALACVGVCSVCLHVDYALCVSVSWYICSCNISAPDRRGSCGVRGSVGGWWEWSSGNNMSLALQLLSADEAWTHKCREGIKC